MMDHSANLPTYEQFLEFRAAVIRAIAVAWNDNDYLDQLLADPVKALHDKFDYRFPLAVDLKAVAETATWTPETTAGWTCIKNNVLELVLPPAPPQDQEAVALAAYNSRNLTPFGR
ncbi:BMA_0021/BMA_0022 family TOMM bacteriocin [Burkholderia sp. TSV86]|uniref:BMA_0021/BMA_0022 family TOMM bacteriocin n=1 Tax=Burkholderia sp. TSV86 TaxID=1385594 RepID=UPI00075D4C75|nr:BMA_0021/BMA_0022 family TOMM bacteriocin [Burkholderia sp. TSV86]KVE38735.1 hypothetical protein WS68_22540 [Burkholderia sp. TSV86]